VEQVISTLISVIVAVGVAAFAFIGINMLVDQVHTRFALFLGGMAALAGLLVGAIMQHNGWLPGGPVWTVGEREIRLLGILLGGLIFGAAGVLIGMLVKPSIPARQRIANRFRPVIFLGPAVFFVSMALVIPSVRTIILSLKEGRRGEGSFSAVNYQDIFTNKSYFSVDGFPNIFTSRLFIFGLILAFLGGLAAWASARRLEGGRSGSVGSTVGKTIGWIVGGLVALLLLGFVEALIRTPNESLIYDVLTVIVSSPVTLVVAALLVAAGTAYVILRRHAPGTMDWGSPGASVMLAVAMIVVLLAVFSTMQGVIWNNLWWVVTVAGLSTFMGLILAILSDRMKGESIAKSFIFMPMAISMVGAAVIWSFMYEIQVSGTQTGLVNAMLEWMGYTPRGFFVNASLIPWNNFFIMLILVWIQTGFAMVVLSAAIKGVPEDMLEAARVDGANEIQTFWRVVIPQIRPTILVVITTLTIVAMKIFDLVKATTGGANRTDVLANAMFDQLRDRNFSLSSAFAVLIFVLTLPVMIYNVRRTQKELA
jgi:alpha-glucoside transport system permease protein